MEQITTNQPFRVIVDYAHTPDGFTQALSTLRDATTGKLIVVFGAAGNRDQAKRPILGQIASEYADTIILTEEDPGTENPSRIIEAIRQGIAHEFVENQNLFIVPTRTEAIKKALSFALPQDTVVTLAMGAQTVMAVGSKHVAYNEREFIRQQLANQNYTSN